jgi:opacity protein-like surface antigen
MASGATEVHVNVALPVLVVALVVSLVGDAPAAPTLEIAAGRGYLYAHSSLAVIEEDASLELESVGSEGYTLRIAPGYEWSWGRARLAAELTFASSNMRAGVRANVSYAGAYARATTGRIVMASARVGVEVAPATQVYGRVGYATMQYRTHVGGLLGDIDERDSGEVQAVVAGAGVQVEFAPGWAVRGEYTHMNFERASEVEHIDGIEGVEEIEDQSLRWTIEPRIETITVSIVRVY